MGDSGLLHLQAVVVECHNDLILLVDRGKPFGRFSFRDHWIPQLRAGGVDVQVIPVSTEGVAQSPEGALRRTLKLVELLHSEVEANASQVALCTSGQDIDNAVASGKIGLILAFEGSASVATDVDLISAFYRLGLRMASFSWFGRTMLADGSGEQDTGGRLTSSGVAALKEMERLGILMDISHLSSAGVEHVLEIATRPVIASHSSARALCDHHRNLTDEQLRAIAQTGGVIGVNFFPGFIDPETPTIDRVVDHIDHIVQVAGMDHVGIGPDFVKELFDEFYPNYPDLKIEGLDATQTIGGLVTSKDLPRLTEKLVERGFKEDEIKAVLGGNFLRVFREVMGVTV